MEGGDHPLTDPPGSETERPRLQEVTGGPRN
jgi:hypothetical protein